MDRESTACWVWFQQLFGCGTARVEEVLTHYPSPQALYNSSFSDLAASGVFKKQELARLSRATLDDAYAILDNCKRLGCRVLTPDHTEYPESLRNIYSIPCALYVQGELDGIDDRLAIGMVGTRHNSSYGRQAANTLSRELAACGVVVVSGLATGIDTVCHVGALKGGGRTIAVTGCGCDINYPAANQELRRLIIKNGAVVSEYPTGTPPLAYHFPIRNRIISGLSQGVVVVEGERRSGSLVTAGHALTQGRDVFAVPGSIFSPGSSGTHWLIRQGAVPVTCTQDILDEYLPLYADKLDTKPSAPAQADKPAPIPAGEQEQTAHAPRQQSAPNPPPLYLTGVQRQLYEQLAGGPQTVDSLTAALGVPVQAVLSALTQMEIYGLVSAHPGRKFSLAS